MSDLQTRSRSDLAVCTLAEGSYHEGVAALLNSLYLAGFRGDFWLGHRGPPPSWSDREPGRNASTSYDGIHIHLMPLTGDTHLSYRKAEFLSSILAGSPSAGGVLYFDPDITCRASWHFFENWSRQGIMLCEDCAHQNFPLDHPHRATWAEAARGLGAKEIRNTRRYFNSGFVGLRRPDLKFLELWAAMMETAVPSGSDRSRLKGECREQPFQNFDQDALNAAVMASDARLSTLGPDGMGFVEGGFVMHHAVDSPKPWRARYLWRALTDGVKPSAAHKDFWRHTESPINLYSPMRRRLARLDIAAALFVNRFYSR